MASQAPTNGNGEHQPTEFEMRRAALVGEIGDSLESVLTQVNALNRSLESIIEIGNEFASVEALWSQFETVMGKTEEEVGADGEGDAADQRDEARAEQSGAGVS